VFLLSCGLHFASAANVALRLSERTTRKIDKLIVAGNTEDIFEIKHGGRKAKLAGFESEIIELSHQTKYRRQIIRPKESR
jgi:hypothetical protein